MHGGLQGEGELIGECPLCKHNLVLVHPNQGGQFRSGSYPFITCTAPATIHGQSRPLPARATKSATVTSEFCPSCPSVRKIKFSFDRALIPPQYHHMAECTVCITCDANFSRMLAMLVGESNGHQMNGNANGLARVLPPPQPPTRNSAQPRQERGRGRGRGGVRARARGRGR